MNELARVGMPRPYVPALPKLPEGSMASVDAFMKRFVDSARRNWRINGPAFTLVLGAGASRSAGVPLVERWSMY